MTALIAIIASFGTVQLLLNIAFVIFMIRMAKHNTNNSVAISQLANAFSFQNLWRNTTSTGNNSTIN